MPGNDLDAITGLEDNHRRALAGKLGITSLQALADADQRAIYTALGSIRPRPSLARITVWQDHARARLREAAHARDELNDRSAWQTAASFAVIFSLRQVDGRWERRIEAEQTEVEPAPEPRHWPSWDLEPLRDWMLSQLPLPEEETGTPASGQLPPAEEETGTPASGQLPPAEVETETPPSGSPGRTELSIDSATITDAIHDLELIRGGQLVSGAPRGLRHPVRLRFTVLGAQPGQQLRAAVWFRRSEGPGWSPQEPVVVPPSGQAEFDLSSVPLGGHNVRLLAWATDPGTSMAAVPLPALTFG